MRVIAGSARRLLLKTVPGMDTRPTTDRIKETLFNMIAPDLQGACFLDLFSGSGGIGIEALSRGASWSCFVEQNKKAVDCIQDNLKHTHLFEKATVMARDVLSAISMLAYEKKEFDFIFMDPPYGKDLEKDALYAIKKADILKNDGVIIVESDLNTEFLYLDEIGFTCTKEKIYKTNKHTFIMKKEDC